MPDVIGIRYLVLCDHAEVAEGKHFMMGAGVSNLVALAGPQSTVLVIPRFAVAIAIDVPFAATSQKHTVRMAVEDSDGQPVLQQPAESQFEVGRPPGMRQDHWMTPKFSFLIQTLQFPKEGIYSVVVDIDGTESARQRVHVQKLQAMPVVGG